MLPYWDNVSFIHSNTESYTDSLGTSYARIGFLESIMMEENRLLASRADKNKNEYEKIAGSSFWSFINQRNWHDLPSLPLLFGEVVLKGVGALIVDIHASIQEKRRDNAKPEGNTVLFLLWGAISAITALVNFFIAQPLFFIANTLLHCRSLIDALITTIPQAFFAPKGQRVDTLLQGLKGIARSLICLFTDAIAGGIAAGVTLLSGGLFAPLSIMLAGGAQAAVMGIMGAAAQATVLAVAATSTALAGTAQQAALNRSSTTDMFDTLKLSAQPVNDDETDSLINSLSNLNNEYPSVNEKATNNLELGPIVGSHRLSH